MAAGLRPLVLPIPPMGGTLPIPRNGAKSDGKSPCSVARVFDAMSPPYGERTPTFQPFPHLQVAPDGGFSRLAQPLVLSPQRYVGAFVTCLVLLLNVQCLARSSWFAILEEFRAFAAHEARGLSSWAPVQNPRPKKFSEHQLGLINFHARGQIVGFVELCGLVHYFGRLVCLLVCCASRRHAEERSFHRWDATAQLFWEWVPGVRSFSAMRVLRYVHPEIMITELVQLMRSRRERRLVPLLAFLLIRLVALVVGLEAFVYKFVVAADRMLDATHPLAQIFVAAGFLNQLVGGVVQVDVLMQRRLFLFLFGGEDGLLDADEAVVLRVWRARLAQALRTQALGEGAKPSGSPVAAAAGTGGLRRWRRHVRWLVCMLTWNHMELQKLVLLEDDAQMEHRREVLRELLPPGDAHDARAWAAYRPMTRRFGMGLQ